MNKLKGFYLYLTVFVTGLVILMIEIAGTRVLAPFYGSTIYVWSSLITVTLACLALGYFVGGKLADKKPELKVLYSIIFLAGLIIFLIPKIDAWILLKSYGLGMVWGPLIATALLFSFPLFFLAMVTPLAVKLKVKNFDYLGATTGSLYATSTVGSLAGALITGFWLIPNYSISVIFNFAAGSLILIFFIWLILKKKISQLFFSLILIILLFIVPAYQITSLSNTKIIYETSSFYGDIKVVDVKDSRYLLIDGISQSGIDKELNKSALSYTTYINLARLLTPDPQTALFFGLGAGVIPKEFKKFGIESDIVEIDPKIEAVAVEFFGFISSDYNIYFTDARYFTKNTDSKYDIIVIDAATGTTVPAHLLSQQAFEEIKERLNNNGVLTININGFIDSSLIQSIYLTLKKVFPDVLVLADSEDDWASIAIFASSSLPADSILAIKQRCNNQDCIDLYQTILTYKVIDIILDQEVKVITDDYNPTAFWQIKSSQAFRQWAIGFFGKNLFAS